MPTSSGSKSAIALDRFTVFATFPKILRLEIWAKAMEGPRDVEVKVVTTQTKGTLFKLIGTTPSVLHACTESREEALKVYSKAFTNSDGTSCIYANPVIDTLIVRIRKPSTLWGCFLSYQTIDPRDNKHRFPDFLDNGEWSSLVNSGFWGDIKYLDIAVTKALFTPDTWLLWQVLVAAKGMEATRGWDDDELAVVFSASKGVNSTAIYQRMERVQARCLPKSHDLLITNKWDAEKWFALWWTLIDTEALRLERKNALACSRWRKFGDFTRTMFCGCV